MQLNGPQKSLKLQPEETVQLQVDILSGKERVNPERLRKHLPLQVFLW